MRKKQSTKAQNMADRLRTMHLAWGKRSYCLVPLIDYIHIKRIIFIATLHNSSFIVKFNERMTYQRDKHIKLKNTKFLFNSTKKEKEEEWISIFALFSFLFHLRLLL